jgi:hypothetical protein
VTPLKPYFESPADNNSVAETTFSDRSDHVHINLLGRKEAVGGISEEKMRAINEASGLGSGDEQIAAMKKG